MVLALFPPTATAQDYYTVHAPLHGEVDSYAAMAYRPCTGINGVAGIDMHIHARNVCLGLRRKHKAVNALLVTQLRKESTVTDLQEKKLSLRAQLQ